MDSISSDFAMPPPRGSLATDNILIQELTVMYWQAVKREISNMILFYRLELVDVFPEPTIHEGELGDVDLNQFRKMFMLWSKAPKRPKDFSIGKLFTRTVENAKEHLNIDWKLRRARCLFQASGLLDIDLIYDHTIQFAPSYRQHLPLVEKIENLGTGNDQAYRGLRCTICQLLIRSRMYYECAQARPCKDLTSSTLPVGISKAGTYGVRKSELSTPLPVAPFRSCPLCVPKLGENSTCSREHLKRIYNSGSKDKPWSKTMIFRNSISRDEDISFQTEHKHDKLMKVLTHMLQIHEKSSILSEINTLNPFFDLLEWLSTLSIPGGLFHVGLMFGPLIIENGVGARKAIESFGVLISPRVLPSLCFDHNAVTASVDSQDSRPDGVYEARRLSLYRNKYDDKLYLFGERKRTGQSGDRNTVATVKRVYGGAFSGHNNLLAQQEAIVLRTFVSVGERLRRHGPPTRQRELLDRAVDKVMKELYKLLDQEVNIHLKRLAKKLTDPKTVLKWHPRSNSCQQFVDTLLEGEDFEHLFPLFPKDFMTSEDTRKLSGFDWPRYLISFNDHIDGLAAIGSQDKSVISKFCRAIRDRCDIIDLAELGFHGPRN